MFQTERILVTTDFSETARSALNYAAELAARLGSEITLLHVSLPYQDDPNDPTYNFIDIQQYEASIQKRLEGAARPLEDRVRTETIRDFSPSSGIIEYAFEQGFDLVVMGTHGRRGLARYFLGSVTEKVVRHAHCPVLTVSSDQGTSKQFSRFSKILTTFDFSENSEAAIQYASTLATRLDAQLEALYVFEKEVHPAYLESWKITVNRDLPAITERARSALQEHTRALGLDDIKIMVLVGEGKAERTITEYATRESFDLIVMGTHGLSGLDHALLGSTTERVVRTSPCPVLTVKLENTNQDEA